MPISVLKRPEVARSLSGNVLAKILANEKVTDVDRAEIRREIESPSGPPPLPGSPEAARLDAAQKWLTSPNGSIF